MTQPNRNSPTADLEQEVEDFYRDFPYPPATDFAVQYADDLQMHCAHEFKKAPGTEISAQIAGLVATLYEYEAPAPTFERQTHTDPIDHARYRDQLLAYLKFINGTDHAARVSSFKWLLDSVFEPLIDALPRAVCITGDGEPDESQTVPLASVLPDAQAVIEAMAQPFIEAKEFDELFYDERLGARTGAHITENIKQRKHPFEGIAAFFDIFTVPVAALREEDPPEPMIAESNWYAHCVLLAQTRFGKTNAISWRIAQLLPQIAQGRASAVVMEPKGVLTEDLLHLGEVWEMRDRVVVIDPSDEQSVSINLFERVGSVNETISRVTRVMNTLTSNLTDLQQSTLGFAIRAMYTLSETPSVRALMEVLRKGKDALDLTKLSGPLRDYFEYDFQPGEGRFVIARLRGLLANPVFESLFAAERSTFDMFKEIQAGKLILIKATGKALAGEVTLYGRFWIEQVNKCIWPRLDLPEEKRTPTTFIIDEAQNYIADDKHVAQMLDQAAEAKIGLLMAMHHMGQIEDDHVRHSIYTNTAIKFSARSSADIHALSGSMGDREGLPKLLPNLPRFHFYMFNPDLTQPIKVKFPLVDFKQRPRILPRLYKDMRDENRRRYASSPQKERLEHVADQSPGISPRAVVLDAHIALEDRLRQVAAVLPNFYSGMSMLEMIQGLHQQKIIDEQMNEDLHKLRMFRNKAAHDASSEEITKEKATEFREAVDYVLAHLQSQPSPIPQPVSEGGTGWR